MSDAPTSVPEFLQQFIEPDPAFTPAPIWWWSGEKLEIGRMRWQMDQLAAMGIRNIVILNLAPSGPLFGSEADDPKFLSEAWWEIFRQICDHAREIGTRIWFYDQIGFSGANYQAELVAAHPEFCAERLKSVVVEGVGELRAVCPGGGAAISAYVLPVGKEGEPRYLAVDEHSASVMTEEPAKLTLIYTIRQGYDYFSPAACDQLLETVYRQFERRLPQHLGTTIVGSFQDELPDLPTWGVTFAEEFAKRFGYRLEPVIHRLFEPGEANRRTRVQYHQLRAALSEAALFKPFYQWHESHGLQCGFDQQSPAREARILGCVYKYADYMRTHQWYAAPGCDLHGNGKLHSSIAFLHDRPRVWFEAFHSTGWGGTIADTFDWMLPYLRSGSNLFNPHAVYYSMRKGWWEWAPPSTCWRQPYARHYRGFAELVARMCKLLSRGIQQATIGVVFPQASVAAEMTPEKHLPEAEKSDLALHRLIGSMRWHQKMTGVLDETCVDFHILDEPAIQNAELVGASLVIRGVPLRAIVLPHVTMLESATAQKLAAFQKAGGVILPTSSVQIDLLEGGKLDLRKTSPAVGLEGVAGRVKELPRTVRTPTPTQHRRVGDVNLLLVPASPEMTTEVKFTDWFASLETASVNPEKFLAKADVVLPAGVKQVWRFNPVDGAITPLAVAAGQHESRLELDFGGSPFALLAWSDSQEASFAEVKNTAALRSVKRLDQDWIGQYVPTLPTEYADIYDPERPEQRLPHTAEVRWVAGEGNEAWGQGIPDSAGATAVRANYGVHGVVRIDEGEEKPLIYSPRYGIAQDSIHLHRLGPKGHVPEEFIDLGTLLPEQAATIRLGVRSEFAQPAVLAIGANTIKTARLNGRELPAAGATYLWMTPAELRAGENELEITLTAVRKNRVRAFWCFLKPGSETAFRRPERLSPPDEPVAGSVLNYRGRFSLTQASVGGTLQVSVGAMSVIYLDEKLLGRQGGFDPYRHWLRGQAYELPPLSAGEHELRVELIEPGGNAPLVTDLRADLADGSTASLITDESWTVSRDGAAATAAKIHLHPEGDAAAWHLYHRAHPLAQTAWLERDGKTGGEEIVLDLPAGVPGAQPRTQWLQWTIPPGATAMHLLLAADAQATLWVEGKPTAIGEKGAVDLREVRARARQAVLRIVSRELGGALLEEPIGYTLGEGIFATGSMLEQGLRSYSGAVKLTQDFVYDGPTTGATLELGHVRGSVEARLNGQSLGCRFIAPWRFDISQQLRQGTNQLELMLCNTLANFLSTWSPTRGWSTDHFEFGVFGPCEICADSQA